MFNFRRLRLTALTGIGMAYTLSNAIQKGIGFGLFMILAGVFSVSEYAEFGKMYAVFAAVSALAYAGITEAVISMWKEYSSRVTELLRTANAVFTLMAIASGVISLLAVIGLNYPGILGAWPYAFVIAAALLSSFFVYQSIIVRFEEYHGFSILLSFGPAVVSYAFSLTAVWLFGKPMYFFIGASVGYLVSFLLYTFPKSVFRGFSFKGSIILEMKRRIPAYTVVGLLSWLLGYGSTFVVEIFFDSFEVSSFVFLYSISSILLLVGSSMNQVWSPRFYNEYSPDAIDVESKYRRFCVVQAIVLGIVGALLILILPFLGTYAGRAALYSSRTLEMFFLFLGYIISVPWWHIQNYYLINNMGKQLMNITILSALVGYGFWILAMILLGSIGIYVGFFVQLLVKLLVAWVPARRRWNLGLDQVAVLVGAAIMLIALWLIL